MTDDGRRSSGGVAGRLLHLRYPLRLEMSSFLDTHEML
jgi:hypothetical protein